VEGGWSNRLAPRPLAVDLPSQDINHTKNQTGDIPDSNTKDDGDSGVVILLDEPTSPNTLGHSGPNSSLPSSPPSSGTSVSNEDDVSKKSRNASYESRKVPCIATQTFTTDGEDQLQIQGRALDEDEKPLHEKAKEDLGTFRGLVEILWAPSSCVIEQMLVSAERPNYSIEKYSCHVLNYPDDMSRTIEFREAAGSVDAIRVTAWARICHGVATWAMNVDWCEYMDVVTRCDESQVSYIQYDVIDFLAEIGLVVESQVAGNRIGENMSELGLKFRV
jgi:hypothetical protein